MMERCRGTTPLHQMVEAVRAQLQAGKVVIVFNEEDETCTILPKEQVKMAM